ncbi:hypothetical protein C8Q77DRAFT_1052370 [Trametes polyzona]|nr:hypothetical protein C8Q77DRAFT_1052370 [Trametes polyzona]
MHNPSLLGFSILLLSCASPTLGAPAEPGSVPPSPAIGFNPPSFNPPSLNPPEPISMPGTPSLGSQAPSLATDFFSGGSQSSSEVVSPAVPTSSFLEISEVAVSSTSTAASALEAMESSPSAAGIPSAHESSGATGHNIVQQPAGTQFDLQENDRAAPTVLPTNNKHAKIAQSVHKKLASKMKSMSLTTTSLSSPPSGSSSALQMDVATSLPASISSAFPTATDPSAAVLASASSGFSEPHFTSTMSLAEPTSGVLEDPNPEVHSVSASDASQRARKSAILAAFLILGTLGALGGGVLCFKCGILPCCHSKDRPRTPRASLERSAEEGLQKWPRIASLEKSIIPGAPPLSDMPSLSRDSHTPSCSTCPDNSMVGMKSGISGGASSWRVFATNEDGEYEDVTHVLASDTFSVRSGASDYASATSASASAKSPSPRDSAASSGSGTQPRSSVYTRTDSRASSSGASVTAESYKSCESRYSTPSFERRLSRESGPSPSASASGTVSVSSSVYRSPSPAASVSVLLLTPEQENYGGLADAALQLPRVVVDDADASVRMMETVVESEGEDMELDSQWDVARAFSAPVQQKVKKAGGAGRGTPGAALAEQTVGTVALGGRTCVLMRG